MHELEIARSAARAGGEIIQRYFREGVDIRSKQDASLVSDADIESERAIVRLIREALPGHSVLGEEEQTADVDAEHLWIVDPLDGTNNFAHQVPHFAVSIAYYHCGKPQCGVIFNPIRAMGHLLRKDDTVSGGQRLGASPFALQSNSSL